MASAEKSNCSTPPGCLLRAKKMASSNTVAKKNPGGPSIFLAIASLASNGAPPRSLRADSTSVPWKALRPLGASRLRSPLLAPFSTSFARLTIPNARLSGNRADGRGIRRHGPLALELRLRIIIRNHANKLGEGSPVEPPRKIGAIIGRKADVKIEQNVKRFGRLGRRVV